MTEPMSVLHLTGKDPSSGQIKTFDFEIVDEVARRQKADKADTVQETTLSRGRKEGTEVGEGSVAFGTDVEASREGSHAEGNGTIANAPYMYAFGEYNTPAEILPEWVAGTEYSTGDKVIYDGKAYVCDTANSDAEFDPAKWTEIEIPEAPVFVIGNGTSENSRGDAFAVERDGDVKAGGDLYTNYDPATGTGKKVATEDYVGDLIGDVVSMEYAVADELPATGEVGTIYLIPNGETSGTDTHDEYIWVPATGSFEKIGNTKVDLSGYALKTDTVLYSTLSKGRREDSTVGNGSFAFGWDVVASGQDSHAEGYLASASGNQSHAEGYRTSASGNLSHAEGGGTTASGPQSHAEGDGTQATGISSHAEGNTTAAHGMSSHAEGSGTAATGDRSHAEGEVTLAEGINSHAEGYHTAANGFAMHAQGKWNKTDDTIWATWVAGTSYKVGDKVTHDGKGYRCKTANADSVFTTSNWTEEGRNGDIAFTIGNGTGDGGSRSNAFTVKWDGTVQEGTGTTASGVFSHAEGYSTTASGTQAHAEGASTTASGNYSHAEGAGTQATGDGSHAEGMGTQAIGSGSHAEGISTTASGTQAHAEGYSTTASDAQAHAEGYSTTASGAQSHAEGGGAQATGYRSHAEGDNTIANGIAMHAQGKFNKPDDAVYPDWVASKSYAVGDKATYQGKGYTCKTANSDDTFYYNKWTYETTNGGEIAFVIGNGTSDSARSNAFAVKWDGSVIEGAGTTASGASSHAEGSGTTASGPQAHAEGGGTTASGASSHAEGGGTTASGPQAHAEGGGTTASGNDSHAEGGGTIAEGEYSHAEGSHTIANGTSMHAQGKYNKPDDTIWPDWVASKSYKVGDKVTYGNNGYTCKTANSDATFTNSKWTKESNNGEIAFVIGNGTDNSSRSNAFVVKWDGSVQEGSGTTATGTNSHAEGYGATASGQYSHAEGSQTHATGSPSHAEGGGTTASGLQSHAEGGNTTAIGHDAHAEGMSTKAIGQASHAEGAYTQADGDYMHVQGKYNVPDSSGETAFIIGNGTAESARSNAFVVKWDGSVQEGASTTASGNYSHAEGNSTTASGNYSHAEGGGTTASGNGSHAEGGGSRATGQTSHAEGDQTLASGDSDHAEGSVTQATGGQSHAEGGGSQATGQASHAEGYGTIANGVAMHAQGKWNKPDDAVYPDWVAGKSYAVGDKVTYGGNGYICKTANSDATFSDKWTRVLSNGDVAFVIGNGTGDSVRSNAFTVKWDGTVQEGAGSRATGKQSHAEGSGTQASGNQSHAEGSGTRATGMGAHAEGGGTLASGAQDHAEGGGTQATGGTSHAEGGGSRATGQASHAEGGSTKASGGQSHAEGGSTTASGNQSHAEGSGTIANGTSMHAQGKFNKPDDTVWPDWVASKSYVVGDKVTYGNNGYTCKTANSDATFTSSNWTQESSNGGEIAFVIGNGTGDSVRSNAFTVKWDGSVQEGGGTTASGSQSHAEGNSSKAIGDYSHAEGQITTTSGRNAHAEGYNTTASGAHAHAEGSLSKAIGDVSHAEGNGTTASGQVSHAEGGNTTASGRESHAEGGNTTASGGQSHAEGISSKASGLGSHAEGEGTIANVRAMHASGRYNKPDDAVYPDWEASKSYAVGDKVTRNGRGYTCKTANSDATFTSSNWDTLASDGGEIAFVIGNGTADNARSNAFAVKWDGTLIMRDVSNGAYYKVYIDGGVLKTEAVV